MLPLYDIETVDVLCLVLGYLADLLDDEINLCFS